ncbi:MAG TPA: carboxypeptidase regulatory-like domain-containing protein, partial [Candidatus Cloacimonadota bacterium]|nr:carboxypeptidase regulatory-like domain-containing protein [Candidatus Cloacimonadota bacterium]
GNAVANFTVNVASYTSIPNEWTEYIVDLSSYVGQSVYLAVQCVSYNRLTFRVDGFDWVVGDDMAAVSVTGPSAPTANTATNYIVTVKNNGGNAQNNYSIKLYVDDEVYETQTGTTIASGATAQHTFSWTPAAAQNYILKGEVVLEGDDNPANDITPDYTVIVQPEGTASVTVGDPNTTTTSNSYPINFTWKSSLSQTLYMEDELQIGGAITMLKYYAVLNGNVPNPSPIKVWMANTSQTAFASTSAWLPLSEFTLVFDGGIDFSASGETVITIPLTTPFAYSGGNLCIMVQRPMDDNWYSTNNWKYTATANYPNRLMYLYSDTVEYDPSNLPVGTRAANVPNTTFSISTAGLATLEGNVTSNGTPIPQATVSIDGTPRSTTTNAQGHYQFDYLTPGTVSITVAKELFNDAHIDDIILVADETTTQDVELSLMTLISASGLVVDSETG